MLYLTYDIDFQSDGMGAQYQRIIGIICIAEYYGYKYVHNPIQKMEHLDTQSYLKNIEDYFQIYKHYPNINDQKYDKVIEYDNPSADELSKHANANGNENILVKIHIPYNICDSNVAVYEKSVSNLRNMITNNSLPFYENNAGLNVAIHIRRGDVDSVTNAERYVSMDQLIQVVNVLKTKYNNSKIYIFTQITEKNKHEFDVFNGDNFIVIKDNEDILVTFNHLVNADVLVTCKSSFSYAAGLYNNNAVYYFDFWHSPLSNWISVNNIEGFDGRHQTGDRETNMTTNANPSNNILCLPLILILLLFLYKRVKKSRWTVKF